MAQFGRSASINVFTPGGTGFYFTELRIDFQITKNSETTPNTAKINIYNLSEDTRNSLSDAFQNGKQKVHLNAGYSEGSGQEEIFNGDVVNIEHQIRLPEVITILDVQDGQKVLEETKVNLSFGAGATAQSVLDAVIDALPLNKDIKKAIARKSENFPNGFSYAGTAKDALKKLAKRFGLDWSVQNNQLVVVSQGENNGTLVAQITPETGLIGFPERIVNKVEKAKGTTTKDTKGWKFRCLLQPKIYPMGKISLKSMAIPKATFFTVVSVVHTGDTHGSNWQSEVEVKE